MKPCMNTIEYIDTEAAHSLILALRTMGRKGVPVFTDKWTLKKDISISYECIDAREPIRRRCFGSYVFLATKYDMHIIDRRGTVWEVKDIHIMDAGMQDYDLVIILTTWCASAPDDKSYQISFAWFREEDE